MTSKTRWLWAVMAGGALALSGCRESVMEDTEDQTQSVSDEDPRDLSGGPEQGTGGAGAEDDLLGGEAPEAGEGSEATQELQGQGEDAPATENEAAR